jgi:hypothetical protein
MFNFLFIYAFEYNVPYETWFEPFDR